MKTDELFYELFRFSPESLLELVRLEAPGPYRFESITVKSTEKRFDGYFKNANDAGPDIFLEIQGYRDNNIYWRLFREICAFHEQRKSGRPFAAIILFVDSSLDPGNPPLVPAPPHRLLRRDLMECLEKIEDNATPLVVLKPLTLRSQAELPKAVGEWKSGIDAMGLPESRRKTLNELLEYAILQRFKTFTLEEIRKMIELTPLEETVAGKQLIQQGMDQGMEKGLEKGLEKGMEKGMEKGQLIGQIQLIQRLLKRPRTPNESLNDLDSGELRAMLATLEGDLSKEAKWS
ncbi:MAG: DUF2887 domain-containing protein [Thermodesulfobacteriota bacterium]